MTDGRHPRATLSRRQRIIRAREFRAVFAARARAADGRLVVYARPNGRRETRLGISAGRRCGKAVARNRIKRLVREAFRLGRAAFPAGYDIVVVPLRADGTFADVSRALAALVPEAIRRSRAPVERAAQAERNTDAERGSRAAPGPGADGRADRRPHAEGAGR